MTRDSEAGKSLIAPIIQGNYIPTGGGVSKDLLSVLTLPLSLASH